MYYLNNIQSYQFTVYWLDRRSNYSQIDDVINIIYKLLKFKIIKIIIYILFKNYNFI